MVPDIATRERVVEAMMWTLRGACMGAGCF